MITAVDETASPLALPSDNIERDRRKAIWEYEEGIVGFSKYAMILARLDYQEGVRSQIKDSLATAEIVYADLPLARDLDLRVRKSRTYGKFARSL